MSTCFSLSVSSAGICRRMTVYVSGELEYVDMCQFKCQFSRNISTYVRLSASSPGIFRHMSV